MNRTSYSILAWQCFLTSAGVARGDEPARRVWIADLLNPTTPRDPQFAGNKIGLSLWSIR